MAWSLPRPARGYDNGYHKGLRRAWALQVAKGNVPCAYCGLLIQIDKKTGIPEPWDLGHDDNDRRKYSGPEHRRCNRNTMQRNKTTRIPDPPHRPITDW